MRIDWKITKKRGNIRPILTYSVTLEECEKELAMPPLRVKSTIPEPPDSWQEYCYPGQLERSGAPADPARVYDLDIPSHKGRAWPSSLRLPWREDNVYPEVEESFRLLRDAFERQLEDAYASLPIREENSIGSSPESRRHIAPATLGARFLRFAPASNDG